jgi:L-iditol 2-dehydrogenase
MKAAFLDKPGHISVKDIPVPDYGPDQVLIQIHEVGLCGSDLHYYKEGRIGNHIVKEPHILGHESAGIIAEVGKAVEGLKPGDRVAVEPGVPCLKCNQCLSGRYNLCDSVQFMGAPPYHGTFREYLAHNPLFVHPLPDDVSFTQGALIEPLAVAYNALSKAAIQPGKPLFISGAGPIGAACLELAGIMGASPVIVSEIDGFRGRMAAGMGADAVIDANTEDVGEKILSVTGGEGCEYGIEASGSEAGFQDTVAAVKRGGTVVLIGMGRETVAMPLTEILKKEAAIHGVYRYANCYKPVLRLLGAGKIQGERWITQRYPLAELGNAMEAALSPDTDKLKMIIQVSG